MSTATVPKTRTTARAVSPKLERLIEKKVREFLLHRPEVLIEALEDAVLGRLIEEGAKSGPASRAKIFTKLRSKRP